MLKKTLIAMAVAGALGCSSGVFAGSSTHHDDHDASLAHPVMTSPDRLNSGASVEIGNGVIVSGAYFDDQFDGVLVSDAQTAHDAVAVGSTSGSGGGIVAFSSDGRRAVPNALKEEVYLVPAPLAARENGLPYWKAEISPSGIGELERLATENVYVVTPIEDALVDPQFALRAGPDAYATLIGEETSSAS